MEYIKTNGELYHHGIQGQKWGVRNGPPYPLKPGAHSAAEKIGNPRIGGVRTNNMGSKEPTATSKVTSSEKDLSSYGFNIKQSPSSIKEDAKAVNPNYKPFASSDYTMNCTNCAMTYSLRRLGLDVEANACPTGRTLNEMVNYFPECLDKKHSSALKINRATTSSNVRETVESVCTRLCDGKEGVGFIGIASRSTGHMFNWERTSDGKIVFVDSQVNHVNDRTVDRYFKYASKEYSTIIVSRLDDCQPNTSRLKEICKNH